MPKVKVKKTTMTANRRKALVGYGAALGFRGALALVTRMVESEKRSVEEIFYYVFTTQDKTIDMILKQGGEAAREMYDEHLETVGDVYDLPEFGEVN